MLSITLCRTCLAVPLAFVPPAFNLLAEDGAPGEDHDAIGMRLLGPATTGLAAKEHFNGRDDDYRDSWVDELRTGRGWL